MGASPSVPHRPECQWRGKKMEKMREGVVEKEKMVILETMWLELRSWRNMNRSRVEWNGVEKTREEKIRQHKTTLKRGYRCR